MALAVSTRETSSTSTSALARPELLAPAGDRTCLIAAVENGADAVYFGLKGHNARARAVNFDLDELPEVMATLHARGVRGYVTLNTLVFPSELPQVEAILRRVTAAGVDAVIVQDIGLARLIRALTPDLEVHASTQMSITSAEGVRLAKELGCTRVILARELSLDEIARVRAEADLPVEVFVHGALCVAYSGQCLTSEALGGRSANRGECAQACRMPYEIICDGQTVDLDRTRFLLSPQDLAAFDLIPRLVEIGVASLKIEGRLKTPEYVANITRHYRRAIDGAIDGQPVAFTRDDVQAMEMSFSRGFSHGFLDGTDHKVLVRGDFAKKRGVFLGTVTGVAGSRIRLDLAAPLKPGDGVVFDGDDDRGLPEQGGRVYEVRRIGRANADAIASSGLVEVGFGRRDLDPRRIEVGQRAWKTDDPELTRRLRETFEGPAHRLVDLDLFIRASAGSPLVVEGTTATDLAATVRSEEDLRPADRHPATADGLREQLGRLGQTIYRLRDLRAEIAGDPLVPRSLLNGLRRDLVAKLDALAGIAPARAVACEPVLPALRAPIRRSLGPRSTDNPVLSALCRETRQALAAVDAGVRMIYLDYQEIKACGEAVAAIRQATPGARIYLATPRIEKPGEGPIFRYLARQGADGLLVRNAGGLAFCEAEGLPFVADFSMNAANDLTVAYLKDRGAERVTASYDLSMDQLADLLDATPPTGWKS